MERLQFLPRHQDLPIIVDCALAHVRRIALSLRVAKPNNDLVFCGARLDLLHLVRAGDEGVLSAVDAHLEVHGSSPGDISYTKQMVD
jgi:hypothetical protein